MSSSTVKDFKFIINPKNFRNKATADELKEAFCRDIDAFSFDLNIDDGKPEKCEPVPR